MPARSFETPEEYVRAVQKNLEDVTAAEKRAEVQLAIRGREVDSWLEKQIASASEPESWIHIMDQKCQWVLDKLELLERKMDPHHGPEMPMGAG